ncbi:MAG: hypothetical protein R3A12_12680 [Ignavibacteria bacterium]
MNILKNKKTLLPLIFIVILSSILITGCSKEDTEDKIDVNGQTKQQSEQL